MKNYTNLILAGLVIVLAAALVGVLTFVKNQPAQERATEPLVEIAAMEPDSAKWGVNFPNQYDSFMKTQTNNIDTTYAGSSQFSWLERDPRQVILFAGYPFSKDYNDDRGHANALEDVRATGRLNLDDSNPKHTPATCYSCKSTDNPGLWAEMGMEAYDKMSFNEMTPNINNAIGCANCHEAETMRLIVTNPALEEAFERQGKDWTTFTRQEMRTVVCANCHVEYYFKGDGKYLTFPWDNGTKVDEMLAYYEEAGFKDWEYPDTGTPMLKAQHPEYEFFTADSTHYKAGVSCADCHMPYTRDGAAKYSSHDVHSPLLNAEEACGQCHTDTEFVVNRVNTIQEQVATTKITTEDAILDAVNAIKAAVAAGNADPALLDQARKLHREAQYMWDIVSAENSTGFHNPEYALKVLAEATNRARQAQMLAAQSINDTSLLATGTYYATPAP
ncbi:MAG TPA: ammonia-forming cytochrome c nitrite reductase subunit c552 [Anaerolineales bacterium]|nr:ammonia-forming cytochrome c nitrite reductase subunit c552 [Anaerolineales bacterium]HMX18064.1 ammonia-forming cytochrome c nitrite reductase subunit c552 [Anaerolineales bacterium]HMX72940.1 ammonia-forming cytochrome c nitrite reductase subunit c552 [Anaerolineales bacterium]HMZ41845.1 ammonia-forming cytochrome c nitrite reductase subunit c552 [Anaerolineales bacterium]HNA52779.1 ammonia-forming cytochrome c nitrite reductase subunit c552 [Anaerolineales bacterium]